MAQKKEYGNSLAGQQAFDRQMYNLGVGISRFERLHENMMDDEGYIKRLSIQPSSPLRQDFFMVITAFYQGEDVVAFQQGTSIDDCLLSFINRLANGSIKWKEDEYAKR